MPQMAPIWWSSLYLMFIMSYIMVMMSMYFFNIYISDKKNIKKMMKMMNWKW